MVDTFKGWLHPRHGKGAGGGQFKEKPLSPQELVQKAKDYAVWAHDSIKHTRKYTKLPYWTHLSNVVEILKTVPHTPEMLAAAWLHDTVEDVKIPLSEIRARFGDKVAALVYWLTDKEDPTLSRAQRKANDRERLSRAPGEAQTIKFADLIDNAKDLRNHDQKFFKVFGVEKKMLLDVMKRGDDKLYNQALALVSDIAPPAPKITYAGGANTSPAYLGKTIDWLHQKYGVNKATVHPGNYVSYPGLFHGVIDQSDQKWGPAQFQYVPPAPPPPLEMEKLKKVGGQMGSNPGGVYEDEKGKKFYIKKGQTPEHVKNEMIAANLAWRAGANVLKYRKVKGGDYIATEMVNLSKNRASQLSSEERRRAYSDFMVHAWLGNYDSIGTGGDNIGIAEKEYSPLALDLGGALEFRPRGKPKGDRFGTEVQEYDAMRHGHNLPDPYPDAANFYKGMTRADIRHSAWKVLDMKDAEIQEIVNKWGGKKELAEKLIARREWIRDKLKYLGQEGPPEDAKSIVVFPVGEDHKLKSLNGIPFQEWTPPESWADVEGQNHNIEEPEFTDPEPEPVPEPPPGQPAPTPHDWSPYDLGLDDFVPYGFPGDKKSDVIALPYTPYKPKPKEKASGLVIREPDGRFWIVRPRNGYGGYEHTFPKGRLDKDLNPQANAIKEAWEESGIKARIVDYIGDFEGTMTKTRYYLAERESGDPMVHQNESDGVLLVPPGRLKEFLNVKRDNEIVHHVMGEERILSFKDFLSA